MRSIGETPGSCGLGLHPLDEGLGWACGCHGPDLTEQPLRHLRLYWVHPAATFTSARLPQAPPTAGEDVESGQRVISTVPAS